MTPAGAKANRCTNHKLIQTIRNKEEWPQQWKECITTPSYKKSDKTVSNNYRRISLLSAMYKILSNILLSKLILIRRRNYWGSLV